MLNDNSRIVVDASSLNDASDDDARRGGGRARLRALREDAGKGAPERAGEAEAARSEQQTLQENLTIARSSAAKWQQEKSTDDFGSRKRRSLENWRRTREG